MGRWNDCAICVCYKSPKTSFSKVTVEFNSILKKTREICSNKIIVVGDLNIDYESKPDHNMFKILKTNNLSYHLPSGLYSTNGDTQIDVAFNNFDGVEFHFYESHFSYHKPIICTFNNDNSNSNLENQSKNNLDNIENNKDLNSENQSENNSNSNNEDTMYEVQAYQQVMWFENLSNPPDLLLCKCYLSNDTKHSMVLGYFKFES